MGVGSTYGKYFLLKKLAAGGMGEIYLARQQGPEGFEKVVVIKRILDHLTDNPEYLQSFLQEARLQARMNHSAIVQIFDLGKADEDDSFYLAMEHVHGKNLYEILNRLRNRDQVLPPALAAAIIERAADGLSYAHSLTDNAGSCLNIVHRDISPHNILVSYQGEVKLIDFGIAKSEMNSVKTEAGTIKGKFFYMSPEQSAARPIDKRSDIFSLGIVAYEAIAGKNPFYFPNVVQTLEAIQRTDPPLLSSLRPELEPLDRVLAKALAKKADDRYADAADFKDDLALARAKLPAPPERLGALVQQLFKEKVEQENRLLVDTDSSSLSSVARTKTPTGKKRASSGPKPVPESAEGNTVVSDKKRERAPQEATDEPPTHVQASATKILEDADPATSPRQTHLNLLAEAAKSDADDRAAAERIRPNRTPIVAGLAVVAIGIVAAAIFYGLPPRGSPQPVVPAKVVAAAAVNDDAKRAEEARKVEAEAAQQKALEEKAKSDEESRLKSEQEKKLAESMEQKKKDEQRKVIEAQKVEEAKRAALEAAKKVADKPKVAVAASLGILMVHVVPTSALSLNGRPVAGERVTLPAAGGAIDVVNAELPLKIKFTFASDGAHLATDPWAIAYVNGVSQGKTPLAIPFDAEPRRVELKRPGLDQPIQLVLRFTRP